MNRKILFVKCLLILCTIFSCKKDLVSKNGPSITIDEKHLQIQELNVGQIVTIPVSVQSDAGIRRLSYFFRRENANGTESGSPVNIDPDNQPKTLNENISFKAEPGLVELIIVSFDRLNNSSEIHIPITEVRELPMISFSDNIKSRETVFENKRLVITGEISSKYELQSIHFKQIINGITGDSQSIPLTSEKKSSFSASVVAQKGLSGIIIEAANKYKGTVADTFKISNIVDDAVDIVLAQGATSIPKLYAGVQNTLSGKVSSGSRVSLMSYAMKTGGIYGPETALEAGSLSDEFEFSIAFNGKSGCEALRLSAVNEGGKTRIVELPVDRIYNKLLSYTVELSTEIGPGKNNWFSAYKSPHVFSASAATTVQSMLDFAFVKYSSNSFRIMPGAVVQAGAAYKNAMSPYMPGFSNCTYTLVTVNRPSLDQKAFDSLTWDEEMNDFLQSKIIAPIAGGGENYNIKTTNRRFNGDLEEGKGFIIGWGSWTWGASTADNSAFGVVMVKSYTESGGNARVTLEIKVPQENMRTRYSSGSTYIYP